MDTHASIITPFSQMAVPSAVYTTSLAADHCEIVTGLLRRVNQNTKMPTTSCALLGSQSAFYDSIRPSSNGLS